MPQNAPNKSQKCENKNGLTALWYFVKSLLIFVCMIYPQSFKKIKLANKNFAEKLFYFFKGMQNKNQKGVKIPIFFIVLSQFHEKHGCFRCY